MSASPTRVTDLRGASVKIGELRIGLVAEVLADAGGKQIIGLEVVSRDRHWFLPWLASTFESGVVYSSSPLAFVAEDQLDSYVRSGAQRLQDDRGSLVVWPDGCIARMRRAKDGVLAAAAEGSTAPR